MRLLSIMSSKVERSTTEPKTDKVIIHGTSKIPQAYPRRHDREGTVNGQPQSLIPVHHAPPPRDTTGERDKRIKVLKRARRAYRRRLARWVTDRWKFVAREKLKMVRASAFHRHRVLRRALLSWRDFIWHTRHEWRMEITAEVHYNLCLQRLCFSSWISFGIEERRKRLKVLKAEEFNRQCLLRVGWKHLLVLLDVRAERKREGQSRMVTALRHWAENLERRCFCSWLRYVACRYAKDEQKVLSGYCPSALCKKPERFQHQLISDRARRLWLARRSVRQWRSALFSHYSNQVQIRTAAMHYKDHVLTTFWGVWCNFHHQRRQMRRAAVIVEKTRLCSVVLTSLKQWRSALAVQQRARTLDTRAQKHRKQAIERRVFFALMDVVQMHRHFERQLARANEFALKQPVRMTFRGWKRVCRTAMMEREAISIGYAATHYSHVLLKSSFKRWVKCAAKKRQNRELVKAAMSTHNTSLMHLCLGALARYTAKRGAIHDLKDTARQFRSQHLQLWSLRLWRSCTGLSLLSRKCELTAVKWRRLEVLHLWQRLAERRRTEKLNALKVEQDGQQRFLHCYLRHWQEFTMSCMRKELMRRRAIRHHYLCLLRQCFDGLAMYAANQSAQHVQYECARAHHARRVTGQVLKIWNNFVVRAQLDRHKRAQAALLWRTHLLRRVADSWSLYVQDRRRKQMLCQLAVGHFRGSLLHRSLRKWSDATSRLLDAQHKENIRVAVLRRELKKKVVARVFGHWLEQIRHRFVCRIRSALAGHHYRRCLLIGVMMAWRKYAVYRQEKQVVLGRATLVYSRLLVARGFAHWRQAYSDRLVEHYRSWLALRHWAWRLQRRAFLLWLVHHARKVKKRDQHRAAVELFRRSLIRDGVTKWVEGAGCARGRRLDAARCVATVEAQRVWTVVERCARHWLRKTAVAKEKRMEELGKSVASWPPNGLAAINEANHYVRSRQETKMCFEQYRPPPPAPPVHTPVIVAPVDYGKYIPPPRERPPPRRPVLLDSSLAAWVDMRNVMGNDRAM